MLCSPCKCTPSSCSGVLMIHLVNQQGYSTALQESPRISAALLLNYHIRGALSVTRKGSCAALQSLQEACSMCCLAAHLPLMLIKHKAKCAFHRGSNQVSQSPEHCKGKGAVESKPGTLGPNSCYCWWHWTYTDLCG